MFARFAWLLPALTLVASLNLALLAQPAAAQAQAPAMTGLHVVGNQIVNDSGQPVRLLGADRGAANPCIQGWGIFSGPADESTVQAMASWHITAVRIPLNEDCWLDINGAPAAYSGAAYQQAITSYVGLLTRYNIAAVLDLHWNAPASIPARNQQPMPDADHAPAFWTSVATTFKANSSVVFDLYNEPYPDNNQDTTAAWSCLLNGCTQSSYVDGNGRNVNYSWQAAGMNQLVSAIRATGATNLIISPGVGWAGLMTHWLEYAPSDPQQNLAAATHIYPNTWCSTPSCWDAVLAPIAAQYPLVVGEMGESDCAHAFVDSLMTWLDQHGGSYLAWHWWPLADVGCSNFPLITDYTSGGATPYGIGLKDHLAALAAAPPATPAPTPAPTSAPVGADVACSVLGSIDVAPAIGGTLATPDGRLSVVVPAGAVTEWTTVSLSLVQQPDSLAGHGPSLQVGGASYRVSAVNTSGQTMSTLNGPIAISATTPEPAVVDPGSGAPIDQAVSVDPNGSVSVELAMLPLAASACP